MVRISAAGHSHVGLVRKENEDVFGEDPQVGLYVVADGMGGHQGGDVAASITVETLLAYCRKFFPLEGKSASEELAEAIRLANEAVQHRARVDRKLLGMGATLCALWVHEEQVTYAHVGDSRIYLFRSGKLERLTQDHSLVTQLLAAGQISEQEAERFIYRHIVTRAIGSRRRAQPDVAEFAWKSGDLFLICSDGLTDGVPDSEIEKHLQVASGVDAATRRLVEAALEAGGQDNVTVLCVKVEDDGLPG